MNRKVLFICALPLFLSGCWKLGPDFIKPQYADSSSWRYKEDNARNTSNTEWWRLIGDPVLNSLVDEAVANNLDIKVAVANVAAYVGKYGTSRANLLPQTSAVGDYNYLLAGGQQSQSGAVPTSQARGFIYLGGQAQWQLDLWGQLRRGMEATEGDLMAQAYSRDAVVLSTVTELADQYITLRAFDKSLEITKSIVDLLHEQVKISRARASLGYTSDVELYQAESELNRRQAFIPLYKQQIAETEHAICVLLGRTPGPIKRGKTIDDLIAPIQPTGLPSDLLRRRPDVQQAEQQLAAATARIGYNIGNYFPQITLTSTPGASATSLADLALPGAGFWSAGAMVMGPIFSAGKNAGLVQTAEAQEQSALESYKRTVLSSFQEYENAVVDTKMTKEQHDKQFSRLVAVKEYARLSNLQFQEGETAYLTVLDSVRNLFDAQSDLINAKKNMLTASIEMYKAMGGGWILSAQEKSKMPAPPSASFYP